MNDNDNITEIHRAWLKAEYRNARRTGDNARIKELEARIKSFACEQQRRAQKK